MDAIKDIWVVTIEEGESQSSAVNMIGKVLCGLAMPAVWTPGDITFQTSLDGGATWLDLYNTREGHRPITINAPPLGKYVVLSPLDFIGCQMLRLQSTHGGSSGVTLLNQTAQTRFALVTRECSSSAALVM